ncbi:MAG: hypothetical protein EOP24_10915 [Hyphomicrobiales bacterium]|nr:MAG: hypothetical protein EOP24_10915 [Hyphomicrobiales bacterium]
MEGETVQPAGRRQRLQWRFGVPLLVLAGIGATAIGLDYLAGSLKANSSDWQYDLYATGVVGRAVQIGLAAGEYLPKQAGDGTMLPVVSTCERTVPDRTVDTAIGPVPVDYQPYSYVPFVGGHIQFGYFLPRGDGSQAAYARVLDMLTRGASADEYRSVGPFVVALTNGTMPSVNLTPCGPYDVLEISGTY